MRAFLLLLSVSCVFAGEWSKSYGVGGSPELIVRCGDANVDLRAGSAGRVDARLTTKGWEVRPGEVEVIEHQTGDRVDIEVRVPKAQNWNWSGNRSMKLEVTVPSEARVHINTGDGNVSASGVSGDLVFQTGDGNIVANSIGGKLEASTGDGNVRIAGRFDAVAVTTGDGNVDLAAAPGSTAASSWRMRTGDGNVKVAVPDDMKADFDLSSGDGHVTSDLPLSLSPGKIGGNQLRGKLNGGGSVLTIRTNDGNIHLASAR
jgi:hypothetical protein